MASNDKKNTTFMDLSNRSNKAEVIIKKVYQSLNERGYNPINQFVGYIMSGDPTYITNYGGARALITEAERDELLEEFVRFYLDNIK